MFEASTVSPFIIVPIVIVAMFAIPQLLLKLIKKADLPIWKDLFKYGCGATMVIMFILVIYMEYVRINYTLIASGVYASILTSILYICWKEVERIEKE